MKPNKNAGHPDFLEPIDLAAIAARVLGLNPQPTPADEAPASPRKETQTHAEQHATETETR